MASLASQGVLDEHGGPDNARGMTVAVKSIWQQLRQTVRHFMTFVGYRTAITLCLQNAWLLEHYPLRNRRGLRWPTHRKCCLAAD